MAWWQLSIDIGRYNLGSGAMLPVDTKTAKRISRDTDANMM